MWVTELPSHRWQGGFRAPGGRKHTKTFDYQYEAEAWALTAEKKAAEAAAVGQRTPESVKGSQPPAVAAPQAPAPALTSPTILAHGTSLVDRRAGRLSAATQSNYRLHLRFLGTDGIGLRPMHEVKRSEVEAWQTAGVRAGTGASTLNARLKVLRMVYLDAMAEFPDTVRHNPTHGVELLPTADLPDRVLSDDEADALMAAAATEALRVQILTALDAGLRWSEVMALTPRAILSADFLSVHQVVERDTNSIRQYTKGHRRRTVPMTTELSAALVPLAEAVEADRGHDALLWPSREGATPMGYWNHMRRDYLPAVEAAKIRAASFHALRHTYGSTLAAAGVARSEIATLMGHADESTTARYIHAGVDGHRLTLVRDAITRGTRRAPLAVVA